VLSRQAFPRTISAFARAEYSGLLEECHEHMVGLGSGRPRLGPSAVAFVKSLKSSSRTRFGRSILPQRTRIVLVP
jgi:hypothetical protein